MKLSTRTTYGLRAMLYLYQHQELGCISISTIAEVEGLPQAYLERLMVPLRAARLVTAEKGVNGGYTLAKGRSELSVWQVIEVLEPQKGMFHCAKKVSTKSCGAGCNCQADASLVFIEKSIAENLSRIKLKDLVKIK